MIQAVLFDMDGTVLDSEPLYHACWERAMDEMHLDLDRDAFFLDVSGMNIPTMRAHCLKTYGADFPFEEVRELRRMYLMQALKTAPPPLKPGVPQIFATLRKMGIRVALATSSSCEYATNLMKRHGIDGCFDAIIGGKELIQKTFKTRESANKYLEKILDEKNIEINDILKKENHRYEYICNQYTRFFIERKN